MSADSKELLEFYKRELGYLRRMGIEFAKKYPKVAGRLELGYDQSPDPHIERMIESFAFLAARIQYNLESEFPELATALLSLLYPQLMTPTPSMAVAQFKPDPDQGGLTSGYLIPKNMPLFAQSEQGDICRFRTCYPIELWPLEVVYADFESTDQFDFLDNIPSVVVALRLKIQVKGQLSEMAINRLRFYLNGDRMSVNTLFELLFCNAEGVAILPEKGNPILLKGEPIQPVGFAKDEDVLPYPPNAHPGYRLLHEYFTFPQKFLFFDLDLQKIQMDGKSFDILILLNQAPGENLVIDRNTFALGCTPIINLFSKTSEPIRLDERLPEYLLIPDTRREKITEVHSIRSISAVSDEKNTTQIYEPFFSYNHRMDRKNHKAYYLARFRPSERKDLPGTQMYLSFVNLDFKVTMPPTSVVFAHTLCTNRRLAEEIPSGAVLQIETAAPVSEISTLGKPTSPIDPPFKGSTLWRLISHLSLNYLSLMSGHESLNALREILILYSFAEHTDSYQQIAGIREMTCRKVIRRMGDDAWRGFCKGIEVTLEFDERMYVGSSAFMLAAVLSRFFPLYASVNSFVQLIIKSKQREGVWKRWPAIAGEKIVF